MYVFHIPNDRHCSSINTSQVLLVFGVYHVGQITSIVKDHVQWLSTGENDSLQKQTKETCLYVMYSWRSQFNFLKSLIKKLSPPPHDGSKGNIQVRIF